MSSIPVATRWKAMNELSSLRIHCAKTGCDLVPLILLDEELQERMEAYCKAFPGEESADVRQSLDMREFMLEQLTPQEWMVPL